MNTPKPYIMKIIAAEYEGDMTLRLHFSNGEERLCDFHPMSEKGVCVKLKDPNYFKSFKLDPYTVDWNDEIGFAPEFLYEHSVPCYPDFNDNKQIAAEKDICG